MDRRNARLASQVFAHLREAIVRGEFPPNTALSEQDLCERLNVSRTPVREALINLAEEELVIIYPQFGTFVAPISLEAVRVGQYVREHLECALVVDVIRQVDDAGIARIRDILDRQAKAPSLEEFYNLDNEFHATLAELSGFAKVWNVILKAKTQFDRVRYLSVHEPHMSAHEPRRTAEIIEEHRAIADAIAARDPEAAQRALRRHLRAVFATVDKMGLAETSAAMPPKRRRRAKPEGEPPAAADLP